MKKTIIISLLLLFLFGGCGYKKDLIKEEPLAEGSSTKEPIVQEPSAEEPSNEQSSDELNERISYIGFSSKESVIGNIPIIILGEVVQVNPAELIDLSSRPENRGKNYDIVTVSDVKVLISIKGDLESDDTVKIMQLGDSFEVDTETYPDIIYLTEGQKAVMFLEDTLNKRYSSPYAFINPIQGYISVTDGKTKVHPKIATHSMFEENISEEALLEDIMSYLK